MDTKVKNGFLSYDENENAFFESNKDIEWCGRKYSAL
jgi:hypothetical protein